MVSRTYVCSTHGSRASPRDTMNYGPSSLQTNVTRIAPTVNRNLQHNMIIIVIEAVGRISLRLINKTNLDGSGGGSHHIVDEPRSQGYVEGGNVKQKWRSDYVLY